MLLKTELNRAGAIAKVPIAWIDSEAASTTTRIGPYLSMLKAMVGMYRKRLPANDVSDGFAAFIEGLSEEEWGSLVENIPVAISEREPAEFSKFDGVSVESLRQVLS